MIKELLQYPRKSTERSIKLVAASLIILANAFNLLLPALVNAAPLQESYIRLDNMRASTFTSGVVAANPATVGTEAGVRVTFPSGFTVSSKDPNQAKHFVFFLLLGFTHAHAPEIAPKYWEKISSSSAAVNYQWEHSTASDGQMIPLLFKLVVLDQTKLEQ